MNTRLHDVAQLAQPVFQMVRRRRLFLENTWWRDVPPPKWTTPNQVILDHPVYRLRRFCSGRSSGAHPVLIVPPEVNHSIVADFGPGQSLVQAAMGAGFETVGVLEWRNPTRETARRTLDSSIQAILDCMAALGGQTHLIGLCQGGWEAAIVAAQHPERVVSLTLVAAPIDMQAGYGLIKMIANATPMFFYEALVDLGGGIMKGRFISTGFDNLLPFERYLLKYLAVWNHLEEGDWMERFHRMNDWYLAPKDLPGRLYLRIVRDLFKRNLLFKGELQILDRQVDLSRITCPLALVAGSKDHITPPVQVWAAREVMRSEQVLQVEIPAGHVGTFIGRSALTDTWPGILTWLLAHPSRERS